MMPRAIYIHDASEFKPGQTVLWGQHGVMFMHYSPNGVHATIKTGGVTRVVPRNELKAADSGGKFEAEERELAQLDREADRLDKEIDRKDDQGQPVAQLRAQMQKVMARKAELRKKIGTKDSSSAYNSALEKFRAASAIWRQAQTDYRSRKIGDSEFLAAKKAFQEAEKLMDAAEAKEKGGKTNDSEKLAIGTARAKAMKELGIPRKKFEEWMTGMNITGEDRRLLLEYWNRI